MIRLIRKKANTSKLKVVFFAQVYLDRKNHTTTGNLKWQFNIGSCGLLVDQISLKVKAVADFGGEIIVTLIGDSGRQRVKYQGGENFY